MSKKDEMVIKFVIHGNDARNFQNPMPKLKMTGKQSWTEKAQKYARYKAHVVNTLINATKGKAVHPMIIRNIGLKGKPLNTKRAARGRMDIDIYFKDHTHGDPENIFGAIADALFVDDKYLDGSFKGQLSSTGRAKVDVTVYLQEN